MRRLADLQALEAARREAALEAGQKVAFGGAALAALFVAGGYTWERLQPLPQLQPEPISPERDTIVAAIPEDMLAAGPPPQAAVGGPYLSDELEAVEPASMPLDLPIATAPPPLHLAENAGVAPVSYMDDVLTIDTSVPQSEIAEVAIAPPPDESGMLAALTGMSVEYVAPEPQVRDVSLFIAADDEAISWSLTGASPNYGAVAYEGDGVEVGNLAVGVALNLQDVRLAAAYVEREVDTRLNANFGEASREQEFVGAIVTVKF
ncbi:MAG: hypothetical protein AB7P07_09870 [Hyphomonadaceae bacterium]